ncbi:hypothetical protein B9T38_00165 [Acinetobacter sp. ANC 4218]|uniref:hypothetical protein n=1 Tax=Acinetobacter sp. ANC 4218 TaxID=1977880 RepID=UPI000A353F23|nr:hypothetical protein [Acinetobacter sp. ANC 4218]OTG74692.1 hypothetical protein B9T38_00165 [Acinetobacter sp. ANC 4218]
MIKAFVHWWASSKLEKEEARTKSLIRELDREKEAVKQRLQVKKRDYSEKIKSHQEKRNIELKEHIEFMNQQLTITTGYLPKLNNFQDLMFCCVDSWMYMDIYQQELNILSKKMNNLFSTINLLDAYMFELKKLSQSQERHAWRELTANRELTVKNNFILKTNERIERTSKSNYEEFKNELRRLQSHRSVLLKQANELRAEYSDLSVKKKEAKEEHENNKNTLKKEYELCVEKWNYISKGFEAYYAFKDCDLEYVNMWMRHLREGGTLKEITQVLRIANSAVDDANRDFNDIKEEFKLYKDLVKIAHDTKVYSDSFSSDKAKRDQLKKRHDEAYNKRQELKAARSFLYDRRNELLGYIERIKPFHPDTMIDTLYEMLALDHKSEAWFIFGINTTKQKIRHWENKQKQKRSEKYV